MTLTLATGSWASLMLAAGVGAAGRRARSLLGVQELVHRRGHLLGRGHDVGDAAIVGVEPSIWVW